MIGNRALILLLASAFSSGASAAMVTVDAGHYNFSYDDSFWNGAAFSQNGNVFSFSNLRTALGTEASASVNHPDAERSEDYRVAREYWPSAPITITADSGYTLQSVRTGAMGLLFAQPGNDPANTLGSFASGSVGFANRWLKSSAGSYWVEGSSVAGQYYETRRLSSGEVTTGSNPSLFRPGAYDFSATTTFSSNTRSVVGEYSAWGEVRARGKGATALAFHDTAYFNVAIAPIPEPETLAMFLAGLGVMGVVARRRKRNGG